LLEIIAKPGKNGKQELLDVRISKSVIRTGLWECLRSVQIFNAILLPAFSAAA